MKLAEYEKALRAIPTALKSDCRYYYYEDYFDKKNGEIRERSFLDFRDTTYEHRFTINDIDFVVEVHFYSGRDDKPNGFCIKHRFQDKSLSDNYLLGHKESYDTIKALFYKEISIDEFFDHFKIDKNILN